MGTTFNCSYNVFLDANLRFELGIRELSSLPDDKNVLSQGSKHEDRIFLDKKERDQFCKLLTSEISVNEFCSKVSFLSKNANLLNKIVTRLKECL